MPSSHSLDALNLIGVWEHSFNGGYDLYQFNKDGTGKGATSNGVNWAFRYDLNAETLKLVYTKENVNSNFPHSFKKVWILTQKSVQTFLSYTGHLFQSPLILFSVSVQRFSVSIQSYLGANEMRGNEQKYIFYKIMIHSFGCSTIMCYICQRIIMHILWVHEVQCP